MDASQWLILIGMVAANVVAFTPVIRRWMGDRRKGVETQALVPLRYIEQIQEGQANYIATLETRVNAQYRLWQQCETDKVQMEERFNARIDELEAKLNGRNASD